MKKLSFLCVLAVLVMFLNGFGPRTKELKLTFKNNGQTIRVKQNQVIKISLSSNITTGYSWNVRKYNKYIIKQISKIKYIRPIYEYKNRSKYFIYTPSMPWINRHHHRRIGQPGRQETSFVSNHKGKTELKIVYKRPWEHNKKPSKVFRIKIIVD